MWVYIDKVPPSIKFGMDEFTLSYCNNVIFKNMLEIAHYDVTYISNINNISFEKLTKDQVLNLVGIKDLQFSPAIETEYRSELQNFREASKLINI
jgi:hypothetical protein